MGQLLAMDYKGINLLLTINDVSLVDLKSLQVGENSSGPNSGPQKTNRIDNTLLNSQSSGSTSRGVLMQQVLKRNRIFLLIENRN